MQRLAFVSLSLTASLGLGAGCSPDVSSFGPPVPKYAGPAPAATAAVTSDLTVDWDLMGEGRMAWSDHVGASIVVLDAATRQVTKLSFAEPRPTSALTFWEGSLALAPGKDLIAFAANMDWTWPSRTFVISTAGGVPTPLAPATVQGTSSFWMPDGASVLFLTGVTQGDGRQTDAIARTRADGSHFERLLPMTRFPGKALLGAGSVSADGKRLLVAAPGDGIYVAALDGASVTRIVASADGMLDYGPVWSPDGARVAFFSTTAPVQQGLTPDHPSTLTLVQADGTMPTVVTTLPAGLVCKPFVAWSPSGKKLAFNGCAFDKNTSAPMQILDLESGAIAPLSTGPGTFADGPSWVL